MRDEGYIKFDCRWTTAPPPPWHKLSALAQWRQLLYDAGLIGVYDDGIGFGNISIRQPANGRFIITGTATGALRNLEPEHFTTVTDYDIDTNRVFCTGPAKASSESLTHAALYEASRSIQAVIHIHHQALWNRYLDELPTSSKDIAYGTPEMAREITRLLRKNGRISRQLVIMGGHEEGVIAYGDSLGQAATTLLNCCDRMLRS